MAAHLYQQASSNARLHLSVLCVSGFLMKSNSPPHTNLYRSRLIPLVSKGKLQLILSLLKCKNSNNKPCHLAFERWRRVPHNRHYQTTPLLSPCGGGDNIMKLIFTQCDMCVQLCWPETVIPLWKTFQQCFPVSVELWSVSSVRQSEETEEHKHTLTQWQSSTFPGYHVAVTLESSTSAYTTAYRAIQWK